MAAQLLECVVGGQERGLGYERTFNELWEIVNTVDRNHPATNLVSPMLGLLTKLQDLGREFDRIQRETWDMDRVDADEPVDPRDCEGSIHGTRRV